MPDSANTPEKQNARAPDFRYIPVDVVGLSMNDNVAKLIFGIEEGKDQFYDQVGIFLTPKTLKLLSIMTTLAVQSAEQIGGEIHLDEEKVRKLYESFKAQQP